MASRRMFSKDVVCSDRFLDMPASAQALYFQYGLEADDDGFVSAPKKILRLTNASDDDLKILVAKGFLIPFDSGVVVIRDWKINNYLRRDRYTPTRFKEEFEQLDTIDDRYQFPRITSHVFRHTFATRAIEAGMPPQVLKTILGHSSLAMTMDLYSHVLPDTKADEMQKIANVF